MRNDIRKINSLLSGPIDQKTRDQIKHILLGFEPFFDFATCYQEYGYSAENYFNLCLTTGHCLEEMNHRHEAVALYRQLLTPQSPFLFILDQCLQNFGYEIRQLPLPNQQTEPKKEMILALCQSLENMNLNFEAHAIYQRMDERDPQVQSASRRCLQKTNPFYNVQPNVASFFMGSAVSNSDTSIRWYKSPFYLPGIFS